MEHIVDLAGAVMMVNGIETLPEGAVRERVVRCERCGSSRIERHTGDPALVCWVHKRFGLVVSPDHFCGYATPKEDCQNTAKNQALADLPAGLALSMSGCESPVLSDGPFAENK